MDAHRSIGVQTTWWWQVEIGPETPADVNSVVRVHLNAWRAGYVGIVPADVLAGLDAAGWAAARRNRIVQVSRPFRTLVARNGQGEVLGFVTVGPYRRNRDAHELDHRIGEIVACYVDPARWGTGVGKSLVAAAIAALARRRVVEVRLWVFEGNTRARRFYERCGFAPDGHRSASPLTRFGRPDVRPGEVRYAFRLRQRRR